jgi:hypothetical protein
VAVLAIAVGVGVWLLVGRDTAQADGGRPVATNDDKQGWSDPKDGDKFAPDPFKDKNPLKDPGPPRDGSAVKPIQPDKPLAAGGIALSDWQVTALDGLLWKEQPFDKMKYSLDDGVLVINNNVGGNHWAGIATKRIFTGELKITAEVRNVTKSLGLRSPTDNGPTTAWAAIGPIPGNDWHTVVIVASRDQIVITVDGTPVQYLAVNLERLTSAVFYFHVNANDTAAIRRFEVVGGRP